MDNYQSIYSNISNTISNTKYVELLHEKTQISHNTLTKICMSLPIVICFTDAGSKLGIFVSGYIFPIYRSYSLMRNNDEKYLDMHKYWIVFVSLRYFENVFSFFVNIIPFFSQMKLLFLILNYTHAQQFTTNFYDSTIQPTLLYITQHVERLVVSQIDLVSKDYKDYKDYKDSKDSKDSKKE